jgi:acyl-CoA hydrolase
MRPFNTNGAVVILNIYKMKEKSFKRPSDSVTVKTEVVCPNDTNPMGILKGGRLVEWMDMAAAGCAQIHTGKSCVTAAINLAVFVEPAKTGDIITIKARITRVFNTSMEIFVRAVARNVTGKRKYLIGESYFTFVALDQKGRPVKTIDVKPVTESQKKQYDEAWYRKEKAAEMINMGSAVY